MRIAIVSDVHGNLDALKQVLDDIDRSNIDDVISLGDNVGYGPEPDAVIKEIQAREISSVIGNHELAVEQPKYLNWFNPVARKSLEKTLKLLSDQALDYISRQKSYAITHDCRFVHGFPPDSAFIYMFQMPDHRKKQVLGQMDEQICFVGHTHLLEMVAYDGRTLESNALDKGVMRLENGKKYIFNIGSVGQPRDGDNRAKYVILDSSQHTLEIRYVAYDIESVIEEIQKAGFPEEHARRLR
jgi:predicted phosphodiesterase